MEGIGSAIIGFLTHPYFLVNWVICIIMLETGLKAIKPLYKKKEGDKERDEKYHSFKRNDLHRIWRPILYIIAPFMLIRWVIGVSAWVLLAIITRIVMIGHKQGEPVNGCRGWFLHFCIKCTAKINMICLGCFFIDIKDVKVDYTEYLGPGWDKNGVDFNKCGYIVVNH